MDGKFVAWADAQVHVLTHSLHYGLAAFEGIRCYKGKSGSAIFRLPEHVDRLFESAHIGLIEMPFDRKQISEAIVETVRVNRLEACYIRPLVYIGYGAMGLYPAENPIKVSIAARRQRGPDHSGDGDDAGVVHGRTISRARLSDKSGAGLRPAARRGRRNCPRPVPASAKCPCRAVCGRSGGRATGSASRSQSVGRP